MIVEVQNVSKSIRGKEIIKGNSFYLRDGEVVALVGPNGAGKTTLLKIIANLITPDSGTINICGYNNQKKRELALSNLAFMQDSTVLYSYITGYDHLYLISKIHSKSINDIEKIIEYIGIKGYVHKKVRTYSLGMKQHLLLAIALLSKPKVLLMDEPLNGLDPSSSLLLRKIIAELSNQGTTIFYSSHILAEVDKVADRIIFIREGKIVDEKNAVFQVISKHVEYIIKVSEHERAINKLKDVENIVDIQSKNKELRITIPTSDLNNIIKKLYDNKIDIIDIEKNKFRTESIYHNLFGDNND
jgi:ABC-2 type transport system ATP-binding protein